MITAKGQFNTIAPLIDDTNAPEIYSDAFAGLVFHQGNVSLTLAATRADHTKIPVTNSRKVVLRLTMPISAVADLHVALGQVIKDLETKGIIKTAPALQVVKQ